MRELAAVRILGRVRRGWRRSLIVAAVLALQGACCTQVGPVVVHGDLTRDEVIRQLGQPSLREVVSAADALQKQMIEDGRLADRVRQLEPQTRFELVIWRARCWTGSGDYFIGLFVPEDGKIMSSAGQPLFAGRTQLN